MQQWALLLYKIPSEPTARRVYVWRKLKRLGALLLHDAVWVLPATPATLEQLQWLAAEIEEMEGSAMVWEAHLSLTGQESNLQDRFIAQAEAGYREILAGAARPDADLAALSKRFQQVQAQDYFRSELADRVHDALAAARGGHEP